MVEYGKVTPKIVTNSPEAWSLAGIAKRLSFAIDNMRLPIACLMVDTPGGGSVSVHRHGNMETWKLNIGGWKYLKIQLFRDDDIVNPLGEPHDSSFYLQVVGIDGYNIVNIHEWEPNSYFKYNADGTRKKDGDGNNIPVYNPILKCWELDSYIWNENEPEHPTTPPRVSVAGVYEPAKVWDGDKGVYISTSTTGFAILAGCENGIGVYYKKLTIEDMLAKKWSRSMDWDYNLVKPGKYVLPIPYFKQAFTSYNPPRDVDNLIWLVTRGKCEVTASVITSVPWIVGYSAFCQRSDPLFMGDGVMYDCGHGFLYSKSGLFPSGYATFEITSEDGVLSAGITGYPASASASGTLEQSNNILESSPVYELRVENPGPLQGIYYFPTMHPGHPSGVFGVSYPFNKAWFRGTLSISLSIDDTYEYSTWYFGQPSPKWWSPS